ncbi:MAG: hypothetical protein WA322_15505 [Pseudolabrys sp.]
MKTPKLVDLHTVRRSRQFVGAAKRLQPFLDALENAEKDEAPTALFRLAREYRNMLAEGIGKRSAVMFMIQRQWLKFHQTRQRKL